ncbi:MAG: rhodanese-like domain-containing protein [Comamonas sp.]
MKTSSLRHVFAGGLTALALAVSAANVYAADGIIVSPQQFQTLSAQSGVKILDIRSEAEYKKGHIPGAIHLPWQAINVSERDGIRNEYADDAQIEKALSSVGLSYDDTVLIYGATSMAGRTFVVLEYAGFDKLHVLNGGISQWKGKLTTKPTEVKPGEFKLTRKKENRIEREGVAQKIGSPKAAIIDGRFLKASEDGAIPSAKLIPVTDFMNAKTSQVRDREEVLKELAAKGVTQDQEVIAYCGSGAFASSSYLFLKDLGFKNVKFYDKSWDDWSRSDVAQEFNLGNFSFAGDALNQPKSLGPKFLNQEQLLAAQKAGAVVVDVRPADDYVVGRLPNSVNVFWNDTLNADRSLKSAEELRKLFAKQGVTADKHVVIFARGGLQLSQSYVVLKLLGFERVDAFEGKFEGWVNPGYGPSKI